MCTFSCCEHTTTKWHRIMHKYTNWDAPYILMVKCTGLNGVLQRDRPTLMNGKAVKSSYAA